MKLRHFVGGSAVVLAGWLGVTFVMDVPAQRYQQRRKATAAVEQSGRAVRPVEVRPGSGTEITQLSVSP